MKQRTIFPYESSSKLLAVQNNYLTIFIVECKKISDEYDDLILKYVNLIDENKRLKYENEFMLKLIEKHGFGEL